MDDFERQVIEALARIEEHNRGQLERCHSHARQIESLQHTVHGNGQPGLAERLRHIYWNMALAGGGVMALFEIFKDDIRRFFSR